ncbi:MAG: A/G-specific adenine glycosylase [Pedobacter sp.]|nr:MAG: A/G-specific adenine glycosylase [Pedobacter sp.]
MKFQTEIINWYLVNKRDLPWRNTTDAYVIWLSEIILQQTRVEQGMPYFYKFLENFPTVVDFANASEQHVLKLWQGLGYYSRGRNMLFTAKYILEQHDGVFPTDYNTLIKLKGVGDYTAAAISSFSNNEIKAVVDGNVFRVLARYFGIQEPINSTLGKKMFSQLAQELITDQQPATYNQAIMEFGALHCKPKQPLCGTCPLQLNCFALLNNKIDVLPKKLKKVKVKERWFNYFVAHNGDAIVTKKREAGDVWQQMYDFPLIETEAEVNEANEVFAKKVLDLFGKNSKISLLSKKKHILTHQIIYVQFFALENYMINFNLHAEIKSVSLAEFAELPHPKVISDFYEVYLKD